MDRVDGQHHLGQVELGHLLRQPVLKLTEQRQQIAAHVVVHDQILARQGDRQVRFNYGFVSFMCMFFFFGPKCIITADLHRGGRRQNASQLLRVFLKIDVWMGICVYF